MSFEVAVILLGVPAVFLSSHIAYRVARAVFSDHWSIDSDAHLEIVVADLIDAPMIALPFKHARPRATATVGTDHTKDYR